MMHLCHALHDMEFRISEALGALSDPKLSGFGTETSGIYPNFRTSDGSLNICQNDSSTVWKT